MSTLSIELNRVWPAGRKTLRALPSSAYLLAVCTSAAVIVAGFGVAASRVGPHHTHSADATSPLLWLVIGVVAVGGRITSLLVQAQAAAALGARNWRCRTERQSLLLVVLICQFPLAIRDTLVGALGLLHAASVGTLVGMETSMFDPFAWWACALFALYARDALGDMRRPARIGLIVGFGGFVFFVKVAMALFALGVGR